VAMSEVTVTAALRGFPWIEPQNPVPQPAPSPTPAPKPPGLPDCVKNYLSKFFDRSMLDAITLGQGIPSYVPMDAAAFTLDDHIYFGEGAFDPRDGIQLGEITLIGHETTHVRQYRQNGSFRQKAKYLVDSAKMGLVGTVIGGTSLGSILSYYGNKFEKQAFEMERKIRDDLAKNGNPCP